MVNTSDIRVRCISGSDANRIIRRLHYSQRAARNPQINLGVFVGDRCGGALQFGPSMDKRKMQTLVAGTPWNGFLELNRMAFADWLPKNSESRALGYALRWIRKTYPQIQWIVSFADATQCGDGTIYRASNFVLTKIKRSANLARLPCGTVVHKMTLESSPELPRVELGGRTYYDVTGGKFSFSTYCRAVGAEIVPGFQLRYMYFLDRTARDRLTVPIIPFDEIQKRGAGMYRGKPTTGGGGVDSDASVDQTE